MAVNDQISSHILRELSANARLTNIELADRVGLSPSACLRRVQELERTGVIAGYSARLNPTALGRGFVAYIMVGLSSHGKADMGVFEKAVVGSPQVRECHNITGNAEYMLRIEAEDLAAYKKLHTDFLGALPNVVSLTTHVVMDSPKCEPN